MKQEQPHYLSYLVRMWRVEGKHGWQWRASLESPESGERRVFPSLEHMIAFLRAQMRSKEINNQYEEQEEE
jgi:hypothetical protein